MTTSFSRFRHMFTTTKTKIIFAIFSCASLGILFTLTQVYVTSSTDVNNITRVSLVYKEQFMEAGKVFSTYAGFILTGITLIITGGSVGLMVWKLRGSSKFQQQNSSIRTNHR